jgi:hypothetical protein
MLASNSPFSPLQQWSAVITAMYHTPSSLAISLNHCKIFHGGNIPWCVYLLMDIQNGYRFCSQDCAAIDLRLYSSWAQVAVSGEGDCWVVKFVHLHFYCIWGYNSLHSYHQWVGIQCSTALTAPGYSLVFTFSLVQWLWNESHWSFQLFPLSMPFFPFNSIYWVSLKCRALCWVLGTLR